MRSYCVSKTISGSVMGIKWCQLPCQAGSNVLQCRVSVCKRVRGQRLQQEKAHALVALDYKAPLTAATEKKKKGGERWDVEENWKVTKRRRNEPETIRWAESDGGEEGDRSEQRKPIQNKRRQKSEEGMEWEWGNFDFTPSSFSPSITTHFGNCILYESCVVQLCYKNLRSIITHHCTLLYFDSSCVFEFENLLVKLSSCIIPWVMFRKSWNVFVIHKSYCCWQLKVHSVPIICPYEQTAHDETAITQVFYDYAQKIVFAWPVSCC